MKLEDKAEDAGGRVHVLIGNHEAMNVVGILDLVSPKEYEAFVDRDSRQAARSRSSTGSTSRSGARREGGAKTRPRKASPRAEFDD